MHQLQHVATSTGHRTYGTRKLLRAVKFGAVRWWRLAAISMTLGMAGSQSAFAHDEPWAQMLNAIGQGANARAAFMPGCVPGHRLRQTPVYQTICPKLRSIPDAVIEAAALPFARRHLSAQEAREAIAFYAAPRGAALREKMIRSIELGSGPAGFTEDDLQLLIEMNNSAFGRALRNFAMDRESNEAISTAMQRYQP